MAFDVVIVGAGPAGLSAAIRLHQEAEASGRALSICVVEKGSEVGAHILSGAVLDPRGLDRLLPDWREMEGAPIETPVTSDRFRLLTRRHAIPLPHPPGTGNRGNYIISLGALCRWLAAHAEQLGINIFPGFAASEVLFDEAGGVRGVATGDMGLDREGKPGPQHQPGVELLARQTLFAEGCRGSLARQLIRRFGLDDQSEPQTYGLGIKELWEVPEAHHRPGTVLHAIGWPLDRHTYGGAFLYHMQGGLVSVGLVVGLDYANPYLSPFEEFQRFKTHPSIRPVFEGGRRIAYGARALNEGGIQSIPRLTFPGGALIGCSAGFVDVARIKGIHNAMASGMAAAEAVAAHLAVGDGLGEVPGYRERLSESWVLKELHQVRNIRPGFRHGLLPGLLNAAVDYGLFRGRLPWTLGHRQDHASLRPAANARPIAYPRPDNTLTFDRLSSVFLSNTNHEENQPCHLVLGQPERAITVNLDVYAAPETRYCPAGVYETVQDPEGAPRLQINAQNCIHCKTCDIKDPTQNITWVPPEGGGGPNYPNL